MASADQISERNLGRQSWSSAPTSCGGTGVRHAGSAWPTGGCGESPRLPGPAAHSGASAARMGGTGWNRSRGHPPKCSSTSDNPSVTAAPCQLPLHKGAFPCGGRGDRTGDADCRVASLLAMTVLNLCHSEEAQRADVGIRPFLRWTGVRAAVRKTRGTARRGRRPLRKGEKAQSTTQASRRAAKRSRPRGRGMGGNRRKGHPKRGTASATAGAALSEAESAGIAAGQIQSLPDK